MIGVYDEQEGREEEKCAEEEKQSEKEIEFAAPARSVKIVAQFGDLIRISCCYLTSL